MRLLLGGISSVAVNGRDRPSDVARGYIGVPFPVRQVWWLAVGAHNSLLSFRHTHAISLRARCYGYQIRIQTPDPRDDSGEIR